MRIPVALVICLALLCACSALSREPATLTPTATQSATPTTPPTTTPANTATPDVTIAPSSTPTPRATPTPSSTATATATFAPTPTPSITPFPVVDLVFDNWDMKEIPANIKDGIANSMVAFLNYNNRQTIANIATAQPNTGIQTLYLVLAVKPRSTDSDSRNSLKHSTGGLPGTVGHRACLCQKRQRLSPQRTLHHGCKHRFYSESAPRE